MAMKPLPDAELLRQLLRYEPDTGRLFWAERTLDHYRDAKTPSRALGQFNGNFAGKEAFTFTSVNGYKKGYLMGRQYCAHRLAWKIMTGDDPIVIDHINGNRSDNRFSNLRSVYPKDNDQNRRLYRNNLSGEAGVYFHKEIPVKRVTHWRARIRADGRTVNLGAFDTKEEAVRARKAAERKYGFHPNHGRKA